MRCLCAGKNTGINVILDFYGNLTIIIEKCFFQQIGYGQGMWISHSGPATVAGDESSEIHYGKREKELRVNRSGSQDTSHSP
jgi:hypothetical protein